MDLRVKRVYDPPSEDDGYRLLVDRLWPRGISKEKGQVDEWLKEIAPSHELRKWYNHDHDKWQEFQVRYFEELRSFPDQLETIRERATDGRVTLLFGSRESRYNNAHALKAYFDS